MNGAGGAAGVFGGQQDCQGITLASGASCHLYFQFSPTAAGSQQDTTSVNMNGQVANFSFTGNGVNPFLISPIGFDFGDVPVGSSSAKQFMTITNVSGVPMLMSGAGGGAGALFGGHNDCDSKTLAPGGWCQQSYQFSPTVAGPQTGQHDRHLERSGVCGQPRRQRIHRCPSEDHAHLSGVRAYGRRHVGACDRYRVQRRNEGGLRWCCGANLHGAQHPTHRGLTGRRTRCAQHLCDHPGWH